MYKNDRNHDKKDRRYYTQLVSICEWKIVDENKNNYKLNVAGKYSLSNWGKINHKNR